MTPLNFPNVKNPISRNKIIEPAHNNAFFAARKLKSYNEEHLSYCMTAETNGPRITSGIPNEVTPKRGILNNERVLPYVDTNFGQEVTNCDAVLYEKL